MTIKNIEKNILKLNPLKRIQIIEDIITSLNTPNPAIERAWGIESDKRLKAYKNGKVKGVSFETIKKHLAR